jgi:type VI secretion system protein ImpK
LPSSGHEITISDPVRFIDELLQDTFLFVMEVLHNRALVRDSAFYRRGCNLVETVKARLESLKVTETFTDQVLYAQCGLIDQVVLNSAPQDENHVWLAAPLQARFIGTMHAGEALPARLKTLLRQPAPDMRLLVLYQRVFALGFGSHTPAFREERRQLMESLDALVPATVLPLSAPLIVKPRPDIRAGLRYSRRFHVVLLLAGTALLWCAVSHFLNHMLNGAFPG